MALRKLTVSDRATVAQEFRVIVEPEEGVDPRACRRVTLYTPDSPTVAFAILPYAVRNATTGEAITARSVADIGSNRHYKTPILPTATSATWEITAEQSIIAAATSDYAEVALVIEYID